MQKEVTGPQSGVANNTAFVKTPQDLVPIDGIRNVLLFAPESDRPRFGQRPGLVAQFEQQLGNGNPVQAFGVIQRSSGVTSYERVNEPSYRMRWKEENDLYRYSHEATSYKRTAGEGTGDPHIAWVLGPEWSIRRCMGRVQDSATPANKGRVLVDNNRKYTNRSDILCVSMVDNGWVNVGTTPTKYHENPASQHQVLMGLNASWHPDAGTVGHAQQHTLVFCSLIDPGTIDTIKGALYTAITCINVDTGEILWRNVCKDLTESEAFNTKVLTTDVNSSAIDLPINYGCRTSGANQQAKNMIAKYLLVQRDYTYVCVSKYVYVFSTQTGQYLQSFDVGGWAREVVRVIPRNGLARNLTPNDPFYKASGRYAAKSLLVVFSGSNAQNVISGTTPTNRWRVADATETETLAGTMPAALNNQYIQALSHWRSGVAECFIQYKLNGSPFTLCINEANRSSAFSADGGDVATQGSDSWYGIPLNKSRFPAKSDEDASPADWPAEQDVREWESGFGGTPGSSTTSSTHGTLRLSRVLDRRPRGGLPFSACGHIENVFFTQNDGTASTIPGNSTVLVGQNPNVYYDVPRANQAFFVSFTNRGYGHLLRDANTSTNKTRQQILNTNSALVDQKNFGRKFITGTQQQIYWLWPDDEKAPTTIAKFDGRGAKLWEVDTQSILKPYYTGPSFGGTVIPNLSWYNDIPNSSGFNGVEATIMAMDVDMFGDVYVAGRRNSVDGQGQVGFNVFKLSGQTGTILWRRRLSGVIGQNCLRVSPYDGTVLLGGKRNDDWDSTLNPSFNKYAFLWKLDPIDGRVLSYQDHEMNASLWNSGVPTSAVDADGNGNSWLIWNSSFGIDVDRMGRVAYTTTPGV